MRMHQGIKSRAVKAEMRLTVAEYAVSNVVVIQVRVSRGKLLFLFRWEWVVWFKGCSFTEESPTGRAKLRRIGGKQ